MHDSPIAMMWAAKLILYSCSVKLLYTFEIRHFKFKIQFLSRDFQFFGNFYRRRKELLSGTKVVSRTSHYSFSLK